VIETGKDREGGFYREAAGFRSADTPALPSRARVSSGRPRRLACRPTRFPSLLIWAAAHRELALAGRYMGEPTNALLTRGIIWHGPTGQWILLLTPWDRTVGVQGFAWVGVGILCGEWVWWLGM
jgi:hypothetical protein